LPTMIKNIVIILLIIIFFAGAVTAAVVFYLYPYNPTQPPLADDTGSSKEGIKEVVKANNEFTFDLYSKLKESENGNIFYSPYSIFSALAMTYEGAAGQTADEMKTVFHFPENSTLRPNFAAIYNSINQGEKDYELRTGNALWVQQDFAFLQDYLNGVEKYYGGKAANVDFAREKEKSRQTINAFIEEQTNNKIKNLIPEGFIDEITRLVLTNAIYFKGTWQWEFDESKTIESDFKITPDNIVKTPMMNMDPEKAKFNYAKTEDLQILELPYKGDEVSMLVLLPKESLDSIESSLTAEKLEEYKSLMKETKLGLILFPKFEFGEKYFMKDVLSKLGMSTAFSDAADFSGMTGKKDLYIDFVIHQSYIKVDEKGTEAAAATGVGMKLVSMPENVFMADHPFIFIIQEKDTGNILFLGRIINPTE